MKQTIFSFLLISVIGMASCRKDKIQLTIKQYDQQQIQNYIAAHGLTGMQRDTSGGDTTGIYYKTIIPGSGKPLDYPDKISYVYTVTTFDGSYASTDTVNNHFYDYVGHISNDNLPLGLQTAIHNILKYPNASMRVLIPSHLAYGVNGTGSGSTQVTNNRIKGNECLDYYIHAVNNFQVYDDMVIQNYMKANNLSGYTKEQSAVVPGNYYYYQVLTPGTGTDPITVNSTITFTDTGQLFNGTIFDNENNSTAPGGGDVNTLIQGVQDALINHATVGTKISILIPSTLGYALIAQTSIPSFSCLRFTFVIISTTP